MNSFERIASAVTTLLVLAAITFGIQSCVSRNWQFEDACRRAGGVVMHSSRVSASGNNGDTDRDICAKIVQAPIAAPIPLPEYRK